jgi:SulP family sulfate permease
MDMSRTWRSLWPVWASGYTKKALFGDAAAGLIMTVLLIPQNLAYAMLAGLPPEVGLYATMLPVLAYAVLGTSMTLAVGPVAVASLMTAASLQGLAIAGTPQYTELAMGLALLAGFMLFGFGVLRLGFLAHFLSHPVLSGFTSGSAVLIALSQLPNLLGLSSQPGNGFQVLAGVLSRLMQSNGLTVSLSVVSLLALWGARRFLLNALLRMGLAATTADLLAKLAPMLVVVVATSVAAWGHLADQGVRVVGTVPEGLPSLTNPLPALAHIRDLWLNALLIALVGFVQSVSVAQSMALRRQEKINPDRELMGLGAANLASALSGAYPVTGGFARTAISFAAGAQTPLAGVFSAILMAGVVSSMTAWFHDMPQAVLAAVIVVSISSLIDLKTLVRAWQYDKADALALLATFAGVLALGVQDGIVLGVVLSLAVLVWRSSRPHMAVVGRLPGTEHFRNIDRHQVETVPHLWALRVDESLFFANIGALEDRVVRAVDTEPQINTVLLICSAVNRVDSTALGVLTELEHSLAQRHVELWLAEVKGPVMDRLAPTVLGKRLKGRVFLSTHEAFVAAQTRLKS